MKKTLALLILLSTLGYSQSGYDFNRADITSLDGISKWKNIGGMDTTASLGVSSNQGSPYNILGNTYYGGVYWDSALTAPYRVRIVLKQLSGTDNVKNFYLAVSNSTSFTTYGAYHLTIQQQATTSDYMYLREANQATTIENGLGGYYPDGITAVASLSNHAANDTFYIDVYADGRKTAARKRGSTIDSLTTIDATYTVTSGAYVWLYGRSSTTPFLIDDFSITALGAAPPPPANIDTVAPSINSFTPSNTNPTTAQSFSFTSGITDNYGIAYVALDSSQNGTTWTRKDSVQVNSGTPQLSYTYQSPTFSSSTVGTTYWRLRTREDSSHAGYIHFDTSATVTVIISAVASGDTTGTYGKKLYGYITFPSDINVPGSVFGGGRMPIDSLPWNVLTHTGFFAADCNADGSWNNAGNGPAYLDKMPLIADYAHTKGVYAGFTFGGSGDAGIRAAISNPAAHPTLIAMLLDLIDNKRQDFIDFDLEGAITGDQFLPFAQRFYDSLQTRYTHNNPAVHPFIVLTVGVSRGSGTFVSSAPYVGILNVMSYDNAGSWWGQINHDCSVTSWQYLNGTGANLDPQNNGSQGGKAFPSMQEGARLLRNAGWPADKIVMGADFNPTTVIGGTWATHAANPVAGRLLRNRQVWTTAPTWSGSGLKFWSQWNASNVLSAVPADSIIWDTNAKTYYAHTGTDLATDKLYLQVSWPGKDSSIYYMRKMVDSMNIGGVMIWGMTETYGTSTPVPAGGWAWLSHQFQKYFTASADTIPPTLNPPTTFSPANGATNQPTTLTFNWNDVATAAAYHLQLSSSATFATTVVDDTTLVTSQRSLTGLSLATTYYGRVRVKNAAGLWGTYSATIAFTTVPAVPGAPALSSPADAATAQPQTMTFAWNAPTTGGTSTHYQIDVDDIVGFSSPFLSDSTITVTSLQVPGLANATTYHWRVRAKSYPGGWGSYSTVRSFTTGMAIPATPNLFSPINGAGNQTTTPTLSWERPAGANSFRLLVDNNIDFSSPVKDTTTLLSAYSAFGLTNGATYYWKVYAIGEAGNSQYSSPFSFTVDITTPPPPPGAQSRNGTWWDRNLGNGGQFTGAPYYGLEERLVDPSVYSEPVDSASVITGPLGYRAKDGTVKRYLTDFTATLSTELVNAIIDSLSGKNLSGIVMTDPVVRNTLRLQNTVDTTKETVVSPSHGSQSGVNISLPNLPGQIKTGDNPQESYGIGGLSTALPIGASSAGLGADFSDSGRAGLALFKENVGESFNLRPITIGDIVDYTPGGGTAPTGQIIIDSLNTNADNDTLTKGITFSDSMKFLNSTTLRGLIYAGTSTMFLHGVTGISLYDQQTGSSLAITGANNGGLFQTAVAQGNDHFEIQYRGSATTRNDSAFQITDSNASGNGKPVFQVSNFGDVSGSPRFTGTDAFTTTASTDTVAVTGAATTDRYFITLTGSAAPSPNDAYRVQVTATGFVIHRSASGTSGLTYDWQRVRVIP